MSSDEEIEIVGEEKERLLVELGFDQVQERSDVFHDPVSVFTAINDTIGGTQLLAGAALGAAARKIKEVRAEAKKDAEEE